uniref:Uncharacterized protein n=1 Tax=Leuconostoc citreum TaxID=33964 RepID=A0A098DLL9_LEUCI|nr:Protein of unknown function [Leuconostoc citreum]
MDGLSKLIVDYYISTVIYCEYAKVYY